MAQIKIHSNHPKTTNMKPSELRIGNLVYDTERVGTEFYIHVIEPFDLQQHNSNCMLPIPLDAEWYKRCNFYRVDHVHGYSFYTFNRKDKANRGLVDLDINENSTTTGGRTINHIKYLHQLQNVFYALNGIEMPITHTELTKKEI